jgi:hypothetical protein
MNKLSTALAWAAAMTTVCGSLSAQAQTSESWLGDLNFAISQKLWWAAWDMAAIDAQVVVPAGSTTPVLQNTLLSAGPTRKAVSITSLSVSSGPLMLGASISPNRRFENPAVAGGGLSRKEYDLNFGYAVSPNLAVTLIQKKGTVSNSVSAAVAAVSANPRPATLSGWGLGISAAAPISLGRGDGQGGLPLRVYGNLAYLEGRSKVGGESYPAAYTIAEAGLSHRIGGSPNAWGGSLSLQVGYRSQIITQRNVAMHTFALTPPGTVLSTQRLDLRTTTDGLVVGLAASF